MRDIEQENTSWRGARFRLALSVCGLSLLLLVDSVNAQEAITETPPSGRRAKIGLVLSGGGARGVAHIGVLKALEELRVPIDYIAGTSMGAVVGGLYASGMSPEEIEHWFAEADWRYLLSDSPPRASRSFRDKEREARLNQNLEIGISRSGEVQLPAGFITGQKVLLNLRELTLPVRAIDDFDRLPIPFRAIATDLQTGEKVVLENGSLAEAMRASMAVPGVFTPFLLDGRLLVDGGLSSNLPIATVRKMGADIVIAVDVRPDLQKTPEELASAIAVANQMLDILIQRDTVAQVQTLRPSDIYVRLPLPGAGSSDFAGSTKNIEPGYAGAMQNAGALRRYAVSDARFGHYVASQRVARVTALRISFLEYPGVNGPLRQPLETEISFAPGDKIERWQLEKELGRIEGFHDAEIADFRVIEVNGEYGLQIETRAKSRGPNYVNLGFDFDYASSGETNADILLSVRLTELNRLGAEWETFLSIGDFTRVFSEWYQPVDPARRFFLAANALYSNDFINALDGSDKRLGFRLQNALGGIDVGARLGTVGELRLGYSGGSSRIGRDLNLPPNSTGWSTRSELRVALTLDTLDRVNFPTRGFFGSALASFSREELGARANYSRLGAQIYQPITFGRNTIVPRLVAGIKLGGNDLPLYDRVPLGGFLQLSGFSRRGLYDQNAAVAELIYYRELAKLPAAFGGGVYAGFSLEAGDVWNELDDFDFGHLKYGGSIFLGADTIIGPLYLGLGGNSDSEAAVYLQLSPILRTDRRPR